MFSSLQFAVNVLMERYFIMRQKETISLDFLYIENYSYFISFIKFKG